MKRGNSLKSNSSSCDTTTANQSPSMGSSAKAPTVNTNDADNLCNEMGHLMYDYEVMSRISELVGTLKGTYSEINLDVTKKILSTIQSSIQVTFFN